MEGQFKGGYLPSMFEDEHENAHGTAFEADQAAAYFLAHSTQNTPHENQGSMNQNCQEYPVHFPDNWPPMTSPYQNSLSHQNRLPPSARSSQSSGSNFRSSNNSTLSQWHVRDSFGSTNTTWSHYSDSSREYNISQAERSLSAHSSLSYPQTSESLEEPPPDMKPKRVSQRQTVTEKEPFSTCVSKVKRPRRSTKEPKYWCTSCGEGFGEKYDWKRHEETFQERAEMYKCDNCDKYYFLDKDFVHHHQKGHKCKTCAENKHVDIARRSRIPRTGWGCGFCLHFDSHWAERCKHIALHFEQGNTMANWYHAKVIGSLLQRPELRTEWRRLLDQKKEENPRFGWNQTDTGRAEGYPDSGRSPQLQDRLEFFDPGRGEGLNASELVQLAYDKGHRRQHKTSKSLPHNNPNTNPGPLQSISESNVRVQRNLPPGSGARNHMTISAKVNVNTHALRHSRSVASFIAPSASNTGNPDSPTRDKELPTVPLESPPPVPPKDYRTHSMASSHIPDWMMKFESWDRITNSIPEDDILPDHTVPMDICQMDFNNFNDFDPGYIHH